MIGNLVQDAVLHRSMADVADSRERARRRRLGRLATALALVGGWLWFRILTGNPVHLGGPHLGPDAKTYLPGFILVFCLVAVIGLPMALAGRSPHVMYRSSEITTTLD